MGNVTKLRAVPFRALAELCLGIAFGSPIALLFSEPEAIALNGFMLAAGCLCGCYACDRKIAALIPQAEKGEAR